MMSISDVLTLVYTSATFAQLFYGEREPVWIVHTPNSSKNVSGALQTPGTPQTVNRGVLTESNHTQTVELKVSLCCEACENRIKHALLNCNGVDSVHCDTAKQRVTVTGNAAPADILKICKKLYKRSELLSGTPGKSAHKNTPSSVSNWSKRTPEWMRNSEWNENSREEMVNWL